MSPELVASLVLRRAHDGGVAKLGDRYLDGGFPIPGYQAGAFDGSRLISADAAAKALRDYFLANVDRGDNAANDELIDALLSRIRAQRASSDGGP